MVAIKDMEMSKSCSECDFLYQRYYETRIVRCKRNNDKIVNDITIRDKYCPLIEIVTCQDCKHCHPDEDGRGYHCERDNYVRFSVHRNFFCADGERRE